ncbi:hypothetical protein GSY74_06230 [Sulfurovum sp. bin170]|uniref:hypothetical protein n=1 Tax=Sulfurovum sp. bin170 TaxID=2695268 RepID=UPI0013E02797|nr:hypothetical protein [Sulfurovum sp. bin170]NEW60876.1 hypothetical protein [Sulfurovum sp. bin170]
MYRVVIMMFAMFLIIGCGSSSSSSEGNSASKEKIFDEEEVSGGVVQKDLKISLYSNESKLLTAVSITEGTQLENKNREIINNPKLVITHGDSIKTREDNSRLNVVKSEIKFTDGDGNKVTLTKPITLSIKAPVGSKPGDSVLVDIPDGTTVSKIQRQEKETLLYVDINGKVTVLSETNIDPEIDITITITKQADGSTITTQTGSEGGS